MSSGQSRRDVAIIANPFSGARANRQLVDELAAALRSEGMRPRLCWDINELASLIAVGDCQAVVSAGGDGTLNRVINARPQAPLAMFPLGNENLFAQEYGYPRDPNAAARLVKEGAVRRVDLGQSGERLFGAVSSLGFAAEVIHRLARWRERTGALRRVKRRTYVLPILAAATRYNYPQFTLTADGVPYRGAHAMILNLPHYAFDFRLAPDARGDDGWLDFVIFERPGIAALARYALSIRRGTHRNRNDVFHGRARQIRIDCQQPVPQEMDGEAAGFAPVDIRILPGALEIITTPGPVAEGGLAAQ